MRKLQRFYQTALLALSLSVFSSQLLANDIQGWWQSWDSLLYINVEQGEARVFAAGILNPSLVKGELVQWSLEKPLVDVENADTALRSRPLLGLEIGAELRQQGRRWQGQIYDPRSGTWYKSRLSIVDGQLSIRGYIGMPMLGQTRVFDRYEPCKVYEDKVMVIWSGANPPICANGSSVSSAPR